MTYLMCPPETKSWTFPLAENIFGLTPCTTTGIVPFAPFTEWSSTLLTFLVHGVRFLGMKEKITSLPPSNIISLQNSMQYSTVVLFVQGVVR